MIDQFEKKLKLSKQFPFPSYDEWKLEAERLLKGAPFDKIMKTDTPEGITLKAMYNEADVATNALLDTLPGHFPYLRGNSILNRVANGWTVQQHIDACSPESWNRKLDHALQRGQSSFRLFMPPGLDNFCYDEFCAYIKGISLTNASFDIFTGCKFTKTYEALLRFCSENEIDVTKLKGAVVSDHTRFLVENGELGVEDSFILDKIGDVTKNSIRDKITLKTLLIDVSLWNESGSSAVEDIGFLASQIVYYVDEMQKRGLSADDIFSKMTFILAVSNNLFMEIAKLRAARYVFSLLAQSYGIKEENAKMRMHVVTSTYTKTLYDPYVNILRTTTEAFSAVVGGCDSLHVTHFDIALGDSNEFSRRIARNQQLVLLEESHLNATNDPAGGSYYVEALTMEIVKKGWELFLEIEDKGGFREALQTGFIQDKVNATHKQRIKNAETRKDMIVGTSVFANLEEYLREEGRGKRELCNAKSHNLLTYTDESRTTTNEPRTPTLPKRRLSEPFETLRSSVENMSHRPKAFVANIGKTVRNKPRVDFCIGFFEPAGIVTTTNEGFDTVEAALEYTLKCDENIIILCSTDDRYPEIVPEFAKVFKAKMPNKALVLAGYPKDHIETFKEAGIDTFVYMRGNLIETVQSVLRITGDLK
jgi:methylmalonyl-CoA mutase